MKTIKAIIMLYKGGLNINGLDIDEFIYNLESNPFVTYNDFEVSGNIVTIYPWELESCYEGIQEVYKLVNYLEGEVVTITI